MKKREIKFRAWSEKDRNWAYGSPWLSPTTQIIAEREKWPLMQYTGIKDKHGTDVYEGDVLCYTDEDGDEQYWPVTFEDGCFIVNGSAIWDYLRYDKNNQPTNRLEPNLEVAGNIYENKELASE